MLDTLHARYLNLHKHSHTQCFVFTAEKRKVLYLLHLIVRI